MRSLLLLTGAAVVVAFFAAELYVLDGRWGLPLDDSWIHLQFAKGLASGEGLAFNPGEPVAGSTAPLWTALLSLLFLLPGDVVLWAKVLGALCYLGGIDVTLRLGRELGLGKGLAALAALLVALTDWLAWSALSGMEVSCFTLLSLWGILLHLREQREPERAPASLLVLAAAVTARPEGALLLVLALADRFLRWQRRPEAVHNARPEVRRALLGALFALCVVAPVLVAYLSIGGSVLPTTFGAKTFGARLGWPSLRSIYSLLGISFRSQPLLVLLAAGGAMELLRRLGRAEDRGLLLPAWAFGLPVAYASLLSSGELVVGNFGRYYFPLLPVFVLLGLLPLQSLVATEGGGHPRSRLLPKLLAFILLVVPTTVGLARAMWGFAQSVANVEASDVRLARWLTGRVDPRALLAVNDIGAVKYLLPNRVLDLAGIASPEIQEFAQRRMVGGRVSLAEVILAFVEERKPDFIAVFPRYWPIPDSRPEQFPSLLRLSIRDNIALAGDELVLYSTPWTRYPLRAEAPISGGSRP